MTNGFDARIPEKVGPGTSADTATAFAKTVSYPFLLTLNLAMKRRCIYDTVCIISPDGFLESSHGTFDPWKPVWLSSARLIPLREENKTLQEKVNALDEENKTLKESLEQEQHTKEEINGRIDTLLSTIREFTAEA